MTDLIASLIVTVVALALAAVIDVYGGDSQPYFSIATLSAGYAVRSGVYKARKPRSQKP